MKQLITNVLDLSCGDLVALHNNAGVGLVLGEAALGNLSGRLFYVWLSDEATFVSIFHYDNSVKDLSVWRIARLSRD